MTAATPDPPRYTVQPDDGQWLVFDSFVQQPVTFGEVYPDKAQAIRAAGRLNTAYRMVRGEGR